MVIALTLTVAQALAGVGSKELDDPPFTIPFMSGGIYATGAHQRFR